MLNTEDVKVGPVLVVVETSSVVASVSAVAVGAKAATVVELNTVVAFVSVESMTLVLAWVVMGVELVEAVDVGPGPV